MIIVYILIGILVLLLLIGLPLGYVKAPPDTAYIISGIKKNPRVLIGRAGIRIPFFERLDKLSLKQVTVDIKTEGYIPTLDFINIQVDAVAKVRVGTDPELIERAMKNFLNKTSQEIISDLQDSLQGNIREIIGTISLKDICNNREEFGNQVQQKASVDMRNLGIEIISCNIQTVEDESDLIQNMGMDNTAKIRKDASIAKTDAEKEIKINQARADKEANDARVSADLEIAQRETDLLIKKAELKKLSDAKNAEAESIFEITKQEQRKIIETTSINADIARKEREVDLAEREVKVKEKALDAEIKKKAEAERFKVQQEADAKLYERTKEAEARKVEAEAEKYIQEQNAQAIRAKGEAEAEAIKAKGLAEAESISKKADAMEKYGKAAIVEMIVNVLPDMARSVAEPVSAIDKVTIIGGNSNGVSDVADNVPILLAKVIESVKESTGIGIKDIVKSYTFEGKTTKNINVNGITPNINIESETKKEE